MDITEAALSSLNIAPIKVAVGCISTPESLKSKSTLVIPILHKSLLPQKGVTSIDFSWMITWGRVIEIWMMP